MMFTVGKSFWRTFSLQPLAKSTTAQAKIQEPVNYMSRSVTLEARATSLSDSSCSLRHRC